MSSFLHSTSKLLSTLLYYLPITAGYPITIVSIKILIIVSMMISNIIDIYLSGIMIVLINGLMYSGYFGLIPSPYLSYLFLTKMELSLIIPFMLEPFSIISQSPTLSNRLSINIPAGSLSIQSLSVAIIIFSTYLVIINIVFRLYLIIYNFEILNSFVQLFIPNLSSIEYLLIIFYSSLSFIPYYPELSVQLILPFTIMIITSTFLFTAFNTLILQLFTISLFCILYSKSAQLPFSTRSSNAISAPTLIIRFVMAKLLKTLCLLRIMLLFNSPFHSYSIILYNYCPVIG